MGYGILGVNYQGILIWPHLTFSWDHIKNAGIKNRPQNIDDLQDRKSHEIYYNVFLPIYFVEPIHCCQGVNCKIWTLQFTKITKKCIFFSAYPKHGAHFKHLKRKYQFNSGNQLNYLVYKLFLFFCYYCRCKI